MDINNLNDCLFYLGINLSLFIIKNLFSYFLSKNLKLNDKKEENKNDNFKYYYKNNNNNNISTEIENMKIQYNNLKQEIEQYNNHQNYVKYTKLNRKLEKLKNEIEKKSLEQTNNNNNNYNNNYNSNQFNYATMNNNNNNIFNFLFLQKNHIFEILIWIITIFLFFLIKNKTLKIPYIEKFQDNILIEFYHKEENFTMVEIPFRTILICETFILIQLNRIIQYIFT